MDQEVPGSRPGGGTTVLIALGVFDSAFGAYDIIANNLIRVSDRLDIVNSCNIASDFDLMR